MIEEGRHDISLFLADIGTHQSVLRVEIRISLHVKTVLV
jgi:hypothetical protein